MTLLMDMSDGAMTSQRNATLRVVIPLISTFGSLIFFFFLLFVLYYFRFHRHGRILLGSGLPGSYDDEQQAIREENMYLHTLDESAQQAYFRAKRKNSSCSANDLSHVP